jgi:hypothetical protein
VSVVIACKTIDNYFVLARAAEHTTLSGEIFFPGGGIDNQSLCSDNTFNLKHTASSELREEMGESFGKKDVVPTMEPSVMVYGGENNYVYTIVYYAYLNLTVEQTQNIFNQHVNKTVAEGKMPELKTLYFVPAQKTAVQEFMRSDKEKKRSYISELLEKLIDLDNGL